jgi:hypothetical protein
MGDVDSISNAVLKQGEQEGSGNTLFLCYHPPFPANFPLGKLKRKSSNEGARTQIVRVSFAGTQSGE